MKPYRAGRALTPGWTGALMDPGFLRSAALDANGEHASEPARGPTLRERWPVLRGALFRALRRR
jgi:hypothetical protein